MYMPFIPQHRQHTRYYLLLKYGMMIFMILLIVISLLYYYHGRYQNNYEKIFEEVLKEDDKNLCYKLDKELISSCLAHYYSNKAVETRNVSICNNLPEEQSKSCIIYYALETGECNILVGEDQEICWNINSAVRE